MVDATLKRWEQVRPRLAALGPVLQREQELIQDILRCGFHGVDKEALRKASHRRRRTLSDRFLPVLENLQEILFKNHLQLLALTTQMPKEKEEILKELDEIKANLHSARLTVTAELQRAKECSDKELICNFGPSLKEFTRLLLKLKADRRKVVRSSQQAEQLVTVLKQGLPGLNLPVRVINPDDLQEFPPSLNGYLKIIEFYFCSDASKYFFGDRYSGPNWFTHLKCNVAIFAVQNESERHVYNQFAVSGGEQKTFAGAPVAPQRGCFQSFEVEDENGQVFDRRNDAEFKLLSDFAELFPNTDFHGNGILWSKKPLCRSCAGAVAQFRARYAGITLKVIEEDF